LGCISELVGNITNPLELQGKVAVFQRGLCAFSIKMKEARQAGAVGVIIINNGNDIVLDV
jgi:hypothetical protein